MLEIACFVSPHGFGHATRAIAVVETCQLIRPDIHAHFFTTVAKSLFDEPLTGFTYHPVWLMSDWWKAFAFIDTLL